MARLVRVYEVGGRAEIVFDRGSPVLRVRVRGGDGGWLVFEDGVDMRELLLMVALEAPGSLLVDGAGFSAAGRVLLRKLVEAVRLAAEAARSRVRLLERAVETGDCRLLLKAGVSVSSCDGSVVRKAAEAALEQARRHAERLEALEKLLREAATMAASPTATPKPETN